MTSRRSWTGLWRVVIVVVALGTVSGTAQAAAPEAAAPACAPSITGLPTFSGPDASLSAVHGLSRTANIAVGSSKGLPAYWTGRTARRVPLPAGYNYGEVLAVNYFGLMVGTVSGRSKPARAFRYWYGASSIVFLPGGYKAVAVNDAGHVVGTGMKNDGSAVGYEWAPGTAVRRTLKLAPNTRLTDVTGINNSGRIIGFGVDDLNSYSAGLTWSSSVTAAGTELNPTPYPNDYDNFFEPVAIDNRNRIAGTDYYSRLGQSGPFFWPSPTGVGADVGGLFGNRADAEFAALSDNKVAVGTASDNSMVNPWPVRPFAALICNGRSLAGPLLELPPLLAGHAAQAFAINNDGRAGGAADDAAGTHPVVWVCALQQARTP